jgi:hypothetical protein
MPVESGSATAPDGNDYLVTPAILAIRFLFRSTWRRKILIVFSSKLAEFELERDGRT